LDPSSSSWKLDLVVRKKGSQQMSEVYAPSDQAAAVGISKVSTRPGASI
jgi:hypothetical protein